MKRNVISLASVFMLSSVLSIGVFAQTKESPSDTAVKATSRAERKLDNISFRMTLRTEWFAERDGDKFNEAVETFTAEAPDRYQTINESGDTRTETIVIAGKTFRRVNDGDWESVAVPPIRKAGDPAFAVRFGDLAGGADRPIGAGKLVAKGTIDGQEVSMYEVRNVRQDGTPERNVRTEVTTYWINTDGLIVRRIIEQEFSGDKRVMRSTANYTYTDIRIDEPILPISTRNQ